MTSSEANDGGAAATAAPTGIGYWIRVRGDRRLAAAVLTLAIWVGFVTVVAIAPTAFRDALARGDAIDTLFGAMITSIVTGTTLVVTIGQLVLTQENGPLGDQRERLTNSMAFRESVADLTGETPPTDPARFLDTILAAADVQAKTLRESLTDSEDSPVRDQIRDLTGRVSDEVRTTRSRLEEANFGSFNVVSAALAFEYGPLLRDARQIDEHANTDFDEGQQEILQDLRSALSLFGPAREHVKTLYFQWALIDLSRQILYAAVPAIIVAGLMIAVVNPGAVGGSIFGLDAITILVGGALAATLVPFVLFLVSILRILTVAKRTLAIEPLVLQDDERT